MTEPNDLKPKQGETSEQFKARIGATERDLKRAAAQAQATPTLDPQKPAEPAPDQVPPAAPPAIPPVPDPLAAKAPAVTGNAEVDEWWAKKGFKSPEDLAVSYRELEREYQRKAQEAAAARQAPPVAPQAPQMPSYPPYYPPAPMQYTPPPPVQPQINVEQLAKQYGFAPEDFERVAAVSNDLARATVQNELNRVLPPLLNQIHGVNREVGRQKEIVDLMGDPAFKNPQVQFEMDRVFREEPTVFQNQAMPIRYAYEKALTRIARANLGGSTPSGAPGVQGVVPPGSRPPTTAGGNGSGGGGAPSAPAPESVTNDIFAGMKLEDKRSHLKAVGAL